VTSVDAAVSHATAGLQDAVKRRETDEEATRTIDKLQRRVTQLETQLRDVVNAANDLQRQLSERDADIARLRRLVRVD